MREYQPNSHKSKEEKATEAPTKEKRVQKVVNGKVKTKKNEGRKLASMFISEDAANVKSYIVLDVLIPAIKKAILDIVTDGADMILYGGSGSNKRKTGNKISYRSYYDDKKDDRRDGGLRAKGRFDYDDLVFDSRGECEAVREQMVDLIDTYGFVTVADMYDMAALPAPYTSNKYGWTNIRTAETVRIKDGYVLKLPKAMPID
jgi:hypothetical protein